jgi:hypothetical protein
MGSHDAAACWLCLRATATMNAIGAAVWQRRRFGADSCGLFGHLHPLMRAADSLKRAPKGLICRPRSKNSPASPPPTAAGHPHEPNCPRSDLGQLFSCPVSYFAQTPTVFSALFCAHMENEMMQKADITELDPAQLRICDAIELELPKMSRKQTAKIVASLKEIMSRGSGRGSKFRGL